MTAYAILDALAGLTDPPVAMAAAIVDGDGVDEAYDHSQESSRFEFGSIGKTMTAQVLAALVRDGGIGLHDPIGTWLAAGDNGDIAVGDLATHTSRLPRIADNADAGDGYDPTDPYKHYTAELAEAALRAATRRTDDVREYSNFAYQLLGVCLERAAGVPFADLLRVHVFEPFGLATATVGLGPNQVQCYTRGQPTPAWSMALAGAGGVSGTLADLVAWGRSVTAEPNAAWARYGDGIIWHNGKTQGSHASLFVNPATGRFAAALIATGDLQHVDHATLVACEGGDPFRTRPEPAGDERNAAAVAFFELLAAEKWLDAQSMMSEPTRVVLTVDRIAEAWREVMGAHGVLTAATATGATKSLGATEDPEAVAGIHVPHLLVSVELTFADATAHGTAHFDADGKVVGVRIT